MVALGSLRNHERHVLTGLSPPDAVLINHSHFDHFLDAYPALALKQWREKQVKLYGGKPRHVVLIDFNTFLKEDPDEQLSVGRIDLIHLEELSREIQRVALSNERGYTSFEKMHIPAVTRMEKDGRGLNVIRIR